MIKDLFKILVLLNNKLLITLMMKLNRKANEIDFEKDGATVGSGNTVNFTGAGVSAVSVSGDVNSIINDVVVIL